MRTIPLAAISIALAALLAAAHGCDGHVAIDSSATGAGDGGAPGSGSGSSSSGGLGGAGGAMAQSSTSSGGGCQMITACEGHIFACGDAVDNDGDGLVDSSDPDCLGSCDNTEEGFEPGIPGQPCCPCLTDCYFDQDLGSGNDDCYWNHRCDPHEVPPDYYPEPDVGDSCAYDPDANTPGTAATCAELSSSQSTNCHDFCGPLVPNGCDCFGCCELPAGSGAYVWLGSKDLNGIGTCDLAHADDPTMCHPCEPVPACMNSCDPCEMCIGKGTLPSGSRLLSRGIVLRHGVLSARPRVAAVRAARARAGASPR
jgi:hypothetical protein